MVIRPASTDDAGAISALISSVAQYFTLHPQGEGAEGFLKTIQPSSIGGYIAAENFIYFAAFVADELAGVVAIRDNNHLFHLFVAPEFQRQRIAERLVPVYERFGFKATGPKVETQGIVFVPMKLASSNEDG